MENVFSLTSLLAEEGHEAAAAASHEPSFWGTMAYAALTLVIVFGYIALARKGFNTRVFKGPFARTAEHLYLFLENMMVGIIGPNGRKYMPFIATFWLMIFASNLVALFFASAPTADLGFNLGMALISITYVQVEGVRANGLIGHLSHFKGPKMAGLMVLISFMIFPIEIVSELMKNVSLSLRLFGNIHGGHQAVEAINKLGETGPVHVPLGALLLPIKLMTCLVQALIFTLLTCVYISLVTHHEEEHSHDEAEHESGSLHTEAAVA